MNAHIRKIVLLLVPALIIPATSLATNVGTGLISQPTYLGGASQPDRIPLAPVIYNANYGYGSHTAIFQSRPCYHGHNSDQGVIGYEQNLAVLFGISADFSDTTQLQGSTLTFHLAKCSPPSNAPYTQEQVLAASLQCVLNHCGELRENAPLNVVIQSNDLPKPAWAAIYTKAYYSEEGSDKNTPKPIVLPGLKLEETPLGVSYIVFETVPSNPKITRREPVFVPFLPEGECDPEFVSLIPVWHGDVWREPLNVLTRPYLPYYEKWSSGSSGRTTESVAIPHMTPPNPIYWYAGMDVNRSDKGVEIKVSDSSLTPSEMAALIFACVVSERPNLERPMTVAIPPTALSRGYRDLLKADPSWENGISCEFAIDPVGLKLLKGSVPGYELKMNYGSLAIVQVDGNIPERTDDPMPAWIEDTLTYIRLKAPAADRVKLAEIKSIPDLLRNATPSMDVAGFEAMVRSLLALWKFDDSPTMLENVWFSSNDRRVRALAAAMVHTKQTEAQESRRERLDLEKECRRFESWEANQRNEELVYPIAAAIQAALKSWEERLANPEKTDNPNSRD
jgi:hypothetical protein